HRNAHSRLARAPGVGREDQAMDEREMTKQADIISRLELAAAKVYDPLLSEAAAEIRSLRRRLELAKSGISERGEYVAGAKLALSITPAGREEDLDELLDLADDFGV